MVQWKIASRRYHGGSEAVIAEKGFKVATMAEIATRSGTKIGSLYRFFPNKESLADTIVASAATTRTQYSISLMKRKCAVIGVLADDLLSLLLEPVFNRPAL